MAARKQPQLWLVSTAGDSSSDLLRWYRDTALRDEDGQGSVLLLEWSAPPQAVWDAPESWRWASPAWDEDRERFTRDIIQTVPEPTFRQEMLNTWVQAANGWMGASWWDACGASKLADPTRKDSPVVAVEAAEDGSTFAVLAWRKGDRVAVKSRTWSRPDDCWRWLRRRQVGALLLPPDLATHYPDMNNNVTVVGTREARLWLSGVERAVRDRRLLHVRTDELLTNHVLAAVARSNVDGTRSISAKHSPGPIQLAKCLVWSVGHELQPKTPRPAVVTG